jgi:hypothetical protein
MTADFGDPATTFDGKAKAQLQHFIDQYSHFVNFLVF